MQHSAFARMHATDDEHVGKVGCIAELELNFGGLTREVLDAEGLGEGVGESSLASQDEHFFDQLDLAICVTDVEVRQFEQDAIAFTGVGQQHDRGLPVEAQRACAQIPHVVEIEALVGVLLDVASVGADEEQPALFGDDWLGYARDRDRLCKGVG